MVEKHYGHINQSAKANAIRALMPDFGIVEPVKVAPLKIGGGA
jgi:hypothetical protein